jgi:hypothetical protein
MSKSNAHFGVLSSELARHSLYKQALADYLPLWKAEFEDTVAANKAGLKELVRKVKPTEMYKMLFYQRLSKLSDAFLLLDECVAYLKLSPSPQRLARAGLFYRDWLQYHHTSFLLAMTAIGDCSIHLVAEAYEVGIHPKDCKLWILEGHKIVSGTDALKALKRVYNEIGNERRHRNPEFHRMERTSVGTVLDEPYFELWGSLLALAEQHEIKKEETDLARVELKRVAARLRRHMRQRGRKLLKLEYVLLDALKPVYDAGSGLAMQRQLDKLIAEAEEAAQQAKSNCT